MRFKRADTGYFEMGRIVVAGRTFTRRRSRRRALGHGDQRGARQPAAVDFGMHDPLGQVVDLPALGFGVPTSRDSR